MRSPYFTAEHDAFRQEVRAVLAAETEGAADVWERECRVPRTLWKTLADHDLLGLLHSRENGGTDRDLFTSVVFLEELGRTGYGGMRAAVSVHAYMATHYLGAVGSPELRAAYLTPAVRGERVAALALTEPGAGSDLSGLSTTASRDGEHYVVRGAKSMVSNGTTADFHVTAVRTTPVTDGAHSGRTGLSLLVIDANASGVTVEPQPTLGWRAAGTAGVTYDGVRVPAGNLVGRQDSGFYYLMRGLQLERLAAAALALGGMDRCLEQTLRFARGRRIFDGPLAGLQAPRHRLAGLATELEAARQLVHHTAWLLQQGELPVTACSMAKLYTTELACRMADLSLQLQGSHGYQDGSEAARVYRDARAATIAAGPSEVMRDIVAGDLPGAMG
ncbi:acyl-CoA dehydrogenase family protein [Streptomyces sp. NBC_01387]|uniref:acyl-CoA dehydrogenase family protein n=1 Tax=unclassified Streptomyces TaxID=2593676 RepID=UPI002024E72E|nr:MULTISPECIES: acyl-CoA dehydrogenase family protein [unclassified Streptomyces]